MPLLRHYAWLGVFLILLSMGLVSCSGTRPDHLGVYNGKLSACPDSPNCVSSQSTGDQHGIDPITFQADPEVVWQNLIDVLKKYPRTVIVKEEMPYMHVEFKSALWGFVDDVEFLLNKEKQQIDIRSASRLGYSDMGVNRKRMEKIRRLLHSAIKSKFNQ